MIDNGMTRPYYVRRLPVLEEWPICDCGAWAVVSINGKLRCWDCAEDEGVELLIRR